jgi:hypothetical protein
MISCIFCLSKILYDVTSFSSTSSLGIMRYCTAVDNRKDYDRTTIFTKLKVRTFVHYGLFVLCFLVFSIVNSRTISHDTQNSSLDHVVVLWHTLIWHQYHSSLDHVVVLWDTLIWHHYHSSLDHVVVFIWQCHHMTLCYKGNTTYIRTVHKPEQTTQYQLNQK